MAGTKFSDYLGLNYYKKAKKKKHFNHLGLAQRPQVLVHTILYHLTAIQHIRGKNQIKKQNKHSVTFIQTWIFFSR